MLYLTKCEFMFFSGLYGLILGSFANVLIHRIPKILLYEYEAAGREYFNNHIRSKILLSFKSPKIKKKIKQLDKHRWKLNRYNLFVPRSSCTSCGAKIKFFDNIPIISYLILKGKCRTCFSPINISYLLVELTSAMGSVGIAYLITSNIAELGSSIFIKFFFLNMFFILSISLLAIDWKHQLLPDSLTFPLGFLGIIFCTTKLSYLNTNESIIGGLIGFSFLWLIFWTYKICTNKIGLGQGDIKLAASLGAWVGLSNIVNVLLIASIFGLLVSFSLMLFKKHSFAQTIAFGPFLILGAHIVILKEFLI